MASSIGDQGKAHLEEAIRLAYENTQTHGERPFGAVLTKDGLVIATGVNSFLATGDPTAHAELAALREAGLSGALKETGRLVMYASGQPCPMCRAGMYLAGVAAAYYAYANGDGEPYGLSSEALSQELAKPVGEQRLEFVNVPVRVEGIDPYEAWKRVNG